MPKIGLLKRETTALLVIDVQERLMPVIYNKDEVFGNVNKLLKGAALLGLKTIITEQYPKGLGNTCPEVELPPALQVIEKVCFSCLQSEQVLQQLRDAGIKSLLLTGVEAHICVLKTCLDALAAGYEVHVAADAIGSRTQQNHRIATERMRQSGAFIASTEMALFMLLDAAGTEEFKAISKLIK
ncbi:MAG: isochorismatase family protein [Chitinophagales bacterium]|nr:isochorismatase family protein [Chitinophagales bacterium]